MSATHANADAPAAENLLAGLDLACVPSPAFVVDAAALARNAALLARLRAETGVRVLLALKGFALWRAFPLLRGALDGVCASGAHEARLGAEEFGGEVHTYAPAFRPGEFAEVLGRSTHVTFNSVAEWQRHRAAAAARGVSCGLRLNPGFSAAPAALYDPCAPGSHLGVSAAALAGVDLAGLDGFHVHALCQQDAAACAGLVEAVLARFGPLLGARRWLNLGGGHHFTRPGYDLAGFAAVMGKLRAVFPGEIYVEPGEAVALHAGVLVATVLDVVTNDGIATAILDTSATAHMPDVLEMPYRPEIVGAGRVGEKAHAFRLAGSTCLAGDVIGTYAFDRALVAGDRLVFLDMAHYSMVKTTTFNGIGLPAIALWHADERRLEVCREFGYADYRGRLA
ncbi:MAG: hypothetical protein RLZZ15_2365 [Verrucomicrobiota bacterium]